MAIRSKDYQDDASRVLVRDSGILHECTRVVEVISGVVKEVWNYISGFLFTSDGYVYQTSDEYLCKCSDQ